MMIQREILVMSENNLVQGIVFQSFLNFDLEKFKAVSLIFWESMNLFNRGVRKLIRTFIDIKKYILIILMQNK